MSSEKRPRIIIVGGGAAGLEVATGLGNRLGRGGKAEIILVDRRPNHVWKPLLHEIAAGTLAVADCEVDYIEHAFQHNFRYEYGEAVAIDRVARALALGAVIDEDGVVGPSRTIFYDYLVLAVGSRTNTFNTPGVEQYASMLNDPDDAMRFRKELLKKVWRVQSQTRDGVSVAIVGGGATGVELATELYEMASELKRYGSLFGPRRLSTTVIDAGQRILASSPSEVAQRAATVLDRYGVRVMTDSRVVEVGASYVKLNNGETIRADLIVWASGIKAPTFLRNLGLSTNKIGQIVINSDLSSVEDENIFALGDCASFTLPDLPLPLPATAQVAHQQATYLVERIVDRLNSRAPKLFRFKDKGGLVSLGNFYAVGHLMAGTTQSRLYFVTGRKAKILYASLFWFHQNSLHGYVRTLRLLLIDRLRKIRRVGVKAY
jgi:NADH dehydrogenase